LYSCDLFNDAVGNSDYLASKGRMIDELQRIWKQQVVV
jgi:hypothetical protein